MFVKAEMLTSEFCMYVLYILRNQKIQICSGITRGRVLNGELYAQDADCFMKISLRSTGLCVYIKK